MTARQLAIPGTPDRPGKPSGPMPDWLRQHLVDKGAMTGDGLTRRARPRPCSRCRTVILTGLDCDTAAVTAVCDPVSLTALGEQLAHLAEPSRRTWTLRSIGGRLQLDGRHWWLGSTELYPAGLGRLTRHNGQRLPCTHDVLPEHRCAGGVRDASLDGFTDGTWHSTPTANAWPQPGDVPPF